MKLQLQISLWLGLWLAIFAPLTHGVFEETEDTKFGDEIFDRLEGFDQGASRYHGYDASAKSRENLGKRTAYIVRLEKSVSHEQFEIHLRDYEMSREGESRQVVPSRITHRYHHISYGVVVEGSTIRELEGMPGVKSVVPVTKKKVLAYSWGVDRINQDSLPLDNNADFSYTGFGVDVYLIDTGIDTTHVEFATGNRTVSNIFNAFSSTPNAANTDGNGHGTHCAGTIGGSTIGVAKNANIYGMKVLSDSGSGSTDSILAAFDAVQARRVQNGYRRSIISMSLGGECDTTDCSQDSLVIGVEEMVAAGIVVSLAAGNEGCNANFESPSAAPNALTGSLIF
jgi:subtilisin family serine protease